MGVTFTEGGLYCTFEVKWRQMKYTHLKAQKPTRRGRCTNYPKMQKREVFIFSPARRWGGDSTSFWGND